MGEIIIKVPAKKKAIQIIKSEKLFEDVLKARQEKFRKKFTDILTEDEEQYKHNDQLMDEVLDDTSVNTTEIILDDEVVVEKIITAHIVDADKSLEVLSVETESLLEDEIINDNKNDLSLDINIDSLLVEKEQPQAIYTELYTISDDNTPIKIEHKFPQKEEKVIETVEATLVQKYIQDAYDKGYTDAKEIAKLEVAQKTAEAYSFIKRIDKVVSDFRNHYSTQVKAMKNRTLNIAMSVAETILEYEIDSNKNIVIDAVRTLINGLDAGEVFAIRINPNDMAILNDAKVDLLDGQKFPNISIISDPNVERGSCCLNTSFGNIDANISTQLKKIRCELEAIQNDYIPTNEELIQDAIPNTKIMGS